MKVDDLISKTRSPLGRAIVALVGISAVASVVYKVGPDRVLRAVSDSARVLPLVILLEVCFIACEVTALRQLYGPDKHRLPTSQLIRSSFIAYAVSGLLPAGRTVGEGVRAAVLSPFVGSVRAAHAATRFQGVLLLANAIAAGACAAAAFCVDGPTIVPLAILANCLLTAVLGGVVFIAAQRSRLGEWLAKLSPRARDFGPSFDAMLRNENEFPTRSLAWATAGRVVQTLQYAVLVAAVGGKFGMLEGLVAEGAHLVGAAIGDLIPSQVGSTEANFALAARTLALASGAAVAIPLIIHIQQFFLIAVGTVLPNVWPAAEPGAAAAVAAAVDPRPSTEAS